MANESHTQPPHHSVCVPLTENPKSIVPNGWARAMAPVVVEHEVALVVQRAQAGPHLVGRRGELPSERLHVRRAPGRGERAVDGDAERLEIQGHATERTRPPVLESRP